MKRTLEIKRILVYYDRPELFVGEDELNLQYLCVGIQNEEFDQYLCIPVSKSRMSDFLHGVVDLLSIIKEPECGEVFINKYFSESDNEDELFIESISSTEISPDWLPEPGYFYRTEISPELLKNTSIEKQKAVCALSVEPNESREYSKIKAKNLVLIVDAFQNFVKQSFKKSLKDIDKPIRELINYDSNYELEAYAFGPGSLTVYFESPSIIDLAGSAPIERALSQIDLLTEHIGNEQDSLPVLRENKGPLIMAYKKILKVVIENNLPFSYSWTTPGTNHVNNRIISIDKAKPIYKLLLEKSDLTGEPKRLEGYVSKIDADNGFWKIHNQIDGKEYKGKCNEDRQVDLKGITILTKKYLFDCIEVIDQEMVSQKETATLLLNSFQEIEEESAEH